MPHRVTKWSKCMCMKESTFLDWDLFCILSHHYWFCTLLQRISKVTYFVAVLLSHRWIGTLTGGPMISIGETTPLPRGQHLAIRARSDLIQHLYWDLCIDHLETYIFIQQRNIVR